MFYLGFLISSPLPLHFLCELLRYEDDSREADVLKKKNKVIIGSLRMYLSMSGLIQLYGFANQACGIMVLIYDDPLGRKFGLDLA